MFIVNGLFHFEPNKSKPQKILFPKNSNPRKNVPPPFKNCDGAMKPSVRKPPKKICFLV